MSDLITFRIGQKIPDSVRFYADSSTFKNRISNAMLKWGEENGKFLSLNLQVHTRSGWFNIQNPETDNVIAVTSELVKHRKSCSRLFDYAEQTLAKERKFSKLASDVATKATRGAPKGSRNAAKPESEKITGKGSYNLHMGDDLKAAATKAAKAEGLSLREWICRVVRKDLGL